MREWITLGESVPPLADCPSREVSLSRFRTHLAFRANFATEAEGGCLRFGVYRSPAAFVAEAARLRHPFDDVAGDCVKAAAARVLKDGPMRTAQKWAGMLRQRERTARALETQEAELHAAMPANVRRIMVLPQPRILAARQ